jgi:hypothetical protein
LWLEDIDLGSSTREDKKEKSPGGMARAFFEILRLAHEWAVCGGLSFLLWNYRIFH